MHVCLVSDRPDSGIPLDECKSLIISKLKPGEDLPREADLFIWDYSPGIEIKQYLENKQAWQHLILVDQKYLNELNAAQLTTCILLKPVSSITLRAFADMTMKALEFRKQAHQADSLRLDRDALLQYVLDVNLKLQEYDQDRSNFLARALHDFRAPLTALHGYCGLLAQSKLGEVTAEQRKLLERMLYSTRRLKRLAEATVELLGQGRFAKTPQRRPGNLEETLRQALHDVRPFLLDKALEVRSRLETPEGTLSFEAEQIQQVLVNLVENSCKFAPKNGSIEIRGYNTRQRSDKQDTTGSGVRGYRVDVHDSGPGVPVHLAEKIFEQYVSCAGGSDRSGGGLGLAICKAIVTAHDGTIWATPSDNGGRFSFVLPLDEDAGVAEEDLAAPELEPLDIAW